LKGATLQQPLFKKTIVALLVEHDVIPEDLGGGLELGCDVEIFTIRPATVNTSLPLVPLPSGMAISSRSDSASGPLV